MDMLGCSHHCHTTDTNTVRASLIKIHKQILSFSFSFPFSHWQPESSACMYVRSFVCSQVHMYVVGIYRHFEFMNEFQTSSFLLRLELVCLFVAYLPCRIWVVYILGEFFGCLRANSITLPLDDNLEHLFIQTFDFNVEFRFRSASPLQLLVANFQFSSTKHVFVCTFSFVFLSWTHNFDIHGIDAINQKHNVTKTQSMQIFDMSFTSLKNQCSLSLFLLLPAYIIVITFLPCILNGTFNTMEIEQSM